MTKTGVTGWVLAVLFFGAHVYLATGDSQQNCPPSLQGTAALRISTSEEQHHGHVTSPLESSGILPSAKTKDRHSRISTSEIPTEASKQSTSPHSASDDQTRSLIAPVDPQLRSAALCELAKSRWAQKLVEQRENLTEFLRKGLPNEEDRQKDLRERVERFGNLLTLEEVERASLREAYEPIYRAATAEVLKAVRQEPPDFVTALDSSFAVFQGRFEC